MKKIIKLAIFLGVICVLASGALYYTNNITAPIIAENKKVATEKLLKEIDSKADKFETKEINDGSIATVYYAYEKDQLKMSIYEVSTYGFQSQVTVLVAIDNSTDKFVGFKVIDQAETPGYGTQITANNAYTKQFSS
ncbi:MAG: FMN-binding protein, partial [Bacilli bacterium]|nr:FMN-binding protein [Bacilli bacterium]